MNTENNQSRPERRLTPEEREIRLRHLKRKRNFRIAVVVVGFSAFVYAYTGIFPGVTVADELIQTDLIFRPYLH